MKERIDILFSPKSMKYKFCKDWNLYFEIFLGNTHEDKTGPFLSCVSNILINNNPLHTFDLLQLSELLFFHLRSYSCNNAFKWCTHTYLWPLSIPSIFLPIQIYPSATSFLYISFSGIEMMLCDGVLRERKDGKILGRISQRRKMSKNLLLCSVQSCDISKETQGGKILKV